MKDKVIRLDTLADDDVISFKSGDYTIRIGNILKKIFNRFENHRRSLHFENILINQDAEIKTSSVYNQHQWFEEGEECELLSVGDSGWRKGRLRISLNIEFIPDQTLRDNQELNVFRKNTKSESALNVSKKESTDLEISYPKEIVSEVYSNVMPPRSAKQYSGSIESQPINSTSLKEDNNWPPEPMN